MLLGYNYFITTAKSFQIGKYLINYWPVLFICFWWRTIYMKVEKMKILVL